MKLRKCGIILPQKKEKVELIDLDWANGWTNTPEIVKKCIDARDSGEKHDLGGRTIGRCTNECWCNTCGYIYRVDSSD